MKILRTELETGFTGKFFEIPIETLDLDDLGFYKNFITGEISSDKINDGYHLKGKFIIPFKETCDRCLIEFNQDNESSFDLVLTRNIEIAEDSRNFDVLLFPDSADSIDLTELFHDQISLEDPFKKLCKENCKGLCSNCGQDLNNGTCDCKFEEPTSVWDKLKDLK